jgi:hypothetical protein
VKNVLRVKALIDVCLEHLESRYCLDGYQKLSVTKRVSKIREQIDLSSANSLYLLKPNSGRYNQNNILEQIHWDDHSDWADKSAY